MDGLSAAASVIAVLEVASKLAPAIYKYITAVKNAYPRCQALLDELGAIRGLLDNASSLLDALSQDSITETALERLHADGSPLITCKKSLEDMIVRFTPMTTRRMGIVQRLRYSITEPEIRSFIAELTRQKQNLTVALSVDSFSRLLSLAESSRRSESSIQDLLKVVNDIRGEQIRTTIDVEAGRLDANTKKLIAWLSPVEVENKHEYCRSLRREGTGACCLVANRLKFGRHQILLLYGYMESVELLYPLPEREAPLTSCLSWGSLVIDYLLKTQDRGGNGIFAFFYCDFSNEASTKPKHITLSLVAQIIRQVKLNWPAVLSDVWRAVEQGLPLPVTYSSICDTVIETVTQSTKITIVIDAIDESLDRQHLLPVLLKLATYPNIRLFGTSRPETDIKTALSGLVSIDMQDYSAQIDEDIAKHVRDEISLSPRLIKFPAHLKEKIVLCLVDKADGMFRWVQCQLLEISRCRRLGSVEKALLNLPPGLNATYERILNAIKDSGDDDIEIARSVVKWIIGASAPLKLTQLAEALKLDAEGGKLDASLAVFDPEAILEICAGLITFIPSSETVVLSHFTVKEFLFSLALRQNREIGIFSLNPADVMEEITWRKLSYLLLDDFKSGPCALEQDYNRRLKEYPLYVHIAKSWYEPPRLHVPDSAVRVYNLMVQLLLNPSSQPKYHAADQIKAYQDDAAAACRSLREVRHYYQITNDPMEYFAAYAPPWMLERVMIHYAGLLDCHIMSTFYNSPLTAATWHRNIPNMKVLLRLGADINLNNGDDFCLLNPLAISIIIGDEDVCHFLLDYGAGCDHVTSTEQRVNGFLYTAAEFGRIGMIKALLDFGVDPNQSLHSTGRTPLHGAILNGSLSAVKLFVEYGCSVNDGGRLSKTPLQWASEVQSESILRYIWDHGGRWDTTSDVLRSALSWTNSAPWANEIIGAKQDSSANFNPTPNDIFNLAFLFCYNLDLPKSICQRILNYAEYWCGDRVHVDHETVVTESTYLNPVPYLSTTVRGRHQNPVQKITFRTVSHDQGFSNDTTFHGTYSHSWTWFEVRALLANGQNNPHHNVRHTLQWNMHASLIWRTHSNTWTYSTHQELLQSLSPGDIVELLPVALFNAWENHIRYAEIGLFCAWI